eukprot:TRINITY_DN6549_c0_g1_i2.p1 TRINITY_DN6549_c0_g1~~TRINITY_DN6549_c0_g1_i2.p1  ORF type:complete len:283 (+),score=32.28 TRINITY_DN6549_c0_g1_i2:190-1038(+)
MDAWHATGATTNDGAQLFVQHIVDRKTLVILVTDFKQLWLEDLTDLELEKRSQECNPHVQFKTGKLLATISTALSTSQDNSTLVIDQTEDKNEMNIEASTRTLGGKLKFVFESKCSLQSPSKFYFYVTRPLLAIAASAAQAPVIGGLNTDGLSVDWCSPEPSAAVLHNPTFQSNLQAVTAALLNRNPRCICTGSVFSMRPCCHRLCCYLTQTAASSAMTSPQPGRHLQIQVKTPRCQVQIAMSAPFPIVLVCSGLALSHQLSEPYASVVVTSRPVGFFCCKR